MPSSPYVGRAGFKLRHALDAFSLDARGLRCADFGCNIGGFTDCLLQAGAERVIAIDTGYGMLDYRLRTDPRVTVRERTNILHADPPVAADRADLVVIDLAWTPQRLAVPAALRWLKDDSPVRIITLIKPHYEAHKLGLGRLLTKGVLPDADAERIAHDVVAGLADLGAIALALTRSPIAGGASKSKSAAARGNSEWLALLKPA